MPGRIGWSGFPVGTKDQGKRRILNSSVKLLCASLYYLRGKAPGVMVPFRIEALTQERKDHLWPVLMPSSVAAPSVFLHSFGHRGEIGQAHIQTVVNVLHMAGEGNSKQYYPLFSVSNTVPSSQLLCAAHTTVHVLDLRLVQVWFKAFLGKSCW